MQPPTAERRIALKSGIRRDRVEAIGMAGHPDDRQTFHITEDTREPVGPGHDAPLTPSFDPTRLDFGHYAGKTIAELVSVDPDYLRWLERHPSGVRYRTEIHRALGVVPYSTDWRR
jgi:hypothetical protein